MINGLMAIRRAFEILDLLKYINELKFCTYDNTCERRRYNFLHYDYFSGHNEEKL